MRVVRLVQLWFITNRIPVDVMVVRMTVRWFSIVGMVVVPVHHLTLGFGMCPYVGHQDVLPIHPGRAWSRDEILLPVRS